MYKHRIYIFVFCFLCLTRDSIATLRSFAGTLKEMHATCLKQQIVGEDIVILDGEVELFVDNKFHIWADKITIDKRKKTVVAEKIKSAAVSFETGDFLLLADKINLNIDKRIGYADNIRIRVDEGFISAGHAEKINDYDWRMEKMVYTPCDASVPHWQFRAHRAVVHGSYFIRGDGLVFKIGRIPVLAFPSMVFPIQGQSKSGFLIPKFSYDYVYGLGFKQEYFWNFNPHADTTFGLDWRAKRGFVFSNELRHARSPDSYTFVNSWYGVTRKDFVLQNNKIVEKTLHRYGVDGQDFRHWDGLFLGGDVGSLMRADFGTDKRIGYNFFNSLDDVDDSFYNSLTLRSCWPKNLIEGKVEYIKTNRKKFLDPTNEEKSEIISQLNPPPNSTTPLNFNKKEIEDRGEITYLPHFEWGSGYKIFKNTFAYRHDMFFDQVLYRQREIESLYLNSVLRKQEDLIPFQKADLVRFGYQGILDQTVRSPVGLFRMYLSPNIQIRSKIEKAFHSSSNVLEGQCFAYGAYRAYMLYGAELTSPELSFCNDDFSYMHVLQPSLSWEFLPKFYQDDWYHIDLWDRAYPKNELALNLRNDICIDNWSFDLLISQPYDFYKQSDIFYLSRGGTDKHILPLRYSASLGKGSVQVSAEQEFDWKDLRMQQSQLNMHWSKDRYSLNWGYLFQTNQLQEQRNLLSNIPHFWLFGASVPLSRHTIFSYDGQFYCEKRPHIFAFSALKPLIHRLRVEYEGHCWGVSVGFEEKKYREYGNNRAERTWFFAFKLESLGSYSQKYKRPSVPTY